MTEKVKPKIVGEDHPKYWPCRYYERGIPCVLSNTERCGKLACVWRCVLHTFQGAEE